jgi:hypothetical protein
MKNLVRHLIKPFCLLLIMSFVLFDPSGQAVKAGMIGTETVVQVQTAQEARAQITAYFERQDVEEAMIAGGLDPKEAKARVDSLSEAEVVQLAQAINELPAGAGAAAVVGAIVFVGVVLLITDIVGLTNVYPFVRSLD